MCEAKVTELSTSAHEACVQKFWPSAQKVLNHAPNYSWTDHWMCSEIESWHCFRFGFLFLVAFNCCWQVHLPCVYAYPGSTFAYIGSAQWKKGGEGGGVPLPMLSLYKIFTYTPLYTAYLSYYMRPMVPNYCEAYPKIWGATPTSGHAATHWLLSPALAHRIHIQYTCMAMVGMMGKSCSASNQVQKEKWNVLRVYKSLTWS